MDPTLVAPTAAMAKKPCSHWPKYTALSFKWKRPCTIRATLGLTLSRSPAIKAYTAVHLLMLTTQNSTLKLQWDASACRLTQYTFITHRPSEISFIECTWLQNCIFTYSVSGHVVTLTFDMWTSNFQKCLTLPQ